MGFLNKQQLEEPPNVFEQKTDEPPDGLPFLRAPNPSIDTEEAPHHRAGRAHELHRHGDVGRFGAGPRAVQGGHHRALAWSGSSNGGGGGLIQMGGGLCVCVVVFGEPPQKCWLVPLNQSMTLHVFQPQSGTVLDFDGGGCLILARISYFLGNSFPGLLIVSIWVTGTQLQTNIREG